MFRLTREVRFAVNRQPDEQWAGKPSNSYGGYPSLREFGTYLTLQVTLAGELDQRSNYVVNIKSIDSAVRERAVPFVSTAVLDGGKSPEQVLTALFPRLLDSWAGLSLERLVLGLSPFLSMSAFASELPMVRLSQKFEFSATHRLHNPALLESQNVQTFGKCNNPYGHGHNYELQVTLAGEPDSNGLLIDVPAFERIVAATVIDRFDHKNLNLELPEFRELIPTVENIAMTIHHLLKPKFAEANAKLAGVTVWETPKTWCEYSE